MSGRYVTSTADTSRPEPARSEIDGRGDPDQHYRLYRLCGCEWCYGSGKEDIADRDSPRCPECRGEGRTLQLVATCGTPQSLGVALVQLAEEGEFADCPVGILEDGGSWLIKPWLPSPRNVSDAGRLLAKSKGDST
jgi:hypothetical protein